MAADPSVGTRRATVTVARGVSTDQVAAAWPVGPGGGIGEYTYAGEAWWNVFRDVIVCVCG